MALEVNPWGNELLSCEKLFQEFGMQKISPETRKKLNDILNFRRGIVFAHRDLDAFITAAEQGKKVAVMSGIKPSNSFHLGSKLTAEEIIGLQKKFGAKVFYCVADLEANADNGLSLEEGAKVAIDNIADLLALGLDEKNAYVYKQSENIDVMRLAHIFASRTTMNTLESLYGHQNLALYFSVFTQAGDIMFPQLEKFGMDNVIVPVGADQDPHIRFTRDLAQKFSKEYGFTLPAATFHRLFRSLNGQMKMSKRDQQNVLNLNDEPEAAKKKVMRALTGGRATEEEQRKKGAEYHKCVVAELDWMHFETDDKKVEERKKLCLRGGIMCGSCKAQVAEKVSQFLKKHQEKKKKMIPRAEKLLEKQ